MLGSAAPPVLPVILSAGLLASMNPQAESKVATALTANGAACGRAAVIAALGLGNPVDIVSLYH